LDDSNESLNNITLTNENIERQQKTTRTIDNPFKCLDGSGRKSFSYRLDDLLEKKVRYNTTAWDADAKSLENVWENNCRLCRWE